MMFINAFAAAITLLSPAVLAAPQIPEVKLKISLCKDAGNMNCFEPVARVNTCENVEAKYDDTITSFDTRGRICSFYIDPDCREAQYFTYRGSSYSIIQSDWSSFNDAISSFLCL
ncbi:uncharacterized protein L3040_005224 [Drepanopeziza brunnea f. sp. 'multigermtubi']|uniref:uncharacterized protein n=1 Tax=Drepanopeziza brunnea f. sp. 'multigermtubi' TaxID=698441 RepID=UPI00239DBD59|nr:hypothetical protein L3040_005224 [Drepanopeziza brunnea f. sp. 'multigermtubi']